MCIFRQPSAFEGMVLSTYCVPEPASGCLVDKPGNSSAHRESTLWFQKGLRGCKLNREEGCQNTLLWGTGPRSSHWCHFLPLSPLTLIALQTSEHFYTSMAFLMSFLPPWISFSFCQAFEVLFICSYFRQMSYTLNQAPQALLGNLVFPLCFVLGTYYHYLPTRS